MHDTQGVVALVAERELELGIVGAGKRHRGVRFEALLRDEVILVCPPGHRFAGKTVTVDDLREETLIVMQQGAGVRQVLDDGLRRLGTRLRDLDVRLELGLQESVRSAVQAGYGVTFISRTAVESDLATGTLAEARVDGLDATREIFLVRGHRPHRDPGRRRLRGVRTRPRRVSRIVRFGPGSLGDVPGVAAELGVERLLVVTTRRGAEATRDIPAVAVYDGVRPHVPVETVHEAAVAARAARADAIVALGGGSAIDTAKATVVELLPDALLPVIAVPTTYAGAEWTPYFGMLLAPGRKGGGKDDRARPAAAVYDPELTLGLPRAATVGTSMNALAHCAEAYYHPETSDLAVSHADAGAAAIGTALPCVVADPSSLEQRTELLRGAMHAALALDVSGLCLGHALAQGLGGRYGLPQGTTNALCLAAALRFNAVAASRRRRRPRARTRRRRTEPCRGTGGARGLRASPRPRRAGGRARRRGRADRRASRERAPTRVPCDAGDVAELLRSIW